MGNVQDRRSSSRLPVCLKVRHKLYDPRATESEAFSEDASIHGLLLLTSTYYMTGSWLKLVLSRVENDKVRVDCMCSVVWVEPYSSFAKTSPTIWKIGIEFVKFSSEEDRRIYEDWITFFDFNVNG